MPYILELVRHPGASEQGLTKMQAYIDNNQEALARAILGRSYRDDSSAVSSPPLRVPNPEIYDRKVPQGMKYYEWVQAKADGDIVVHPYVHEHVECHYSDTPGYRKGKRIAWSGWHMPGPTYPERFPPATWTFNEPGPGRRYGNFIAIAVYETERVEPVYSAAVYPCRPYKRWDETERKLVVTSTLAKANSGDWDALTDVAEFRETVGFVTDKILQAVNLIKRFKKRWYLLANESQSQKRRRRQRESAQRASSYDGHKKIDAASQAWLEMRYALRPLIYSIEGIMSVFDNMEREYFRYNGFSRVESEFESESSLFEPDGEHRLVYTYRCMVKRRYDASAVFDALDRAIMTNFAVTAWEVTTLSFVIDWFINIGDWLAAVTNVPPSCEQGMTSSVRVDRSGILKHQPGPAGPTTTVLLNEKSYYRFEADASDVVLGINVNLNWKRMLDAFALAWGSHRMHLLKERNNLRI
uniref:A-protein n=1 Tax=Ketchum virus TaxID=2707227 RepID=A0A6H0DK79_9VIRU|nr:MAG: A-protein [Ketchum virus]